MDARNDALGETRATPGRQNLRDIIEKNIVIFFLLAVITSFGAGFSAHIKLLDLTDRVALTKNSYYLKTDVIGHVIGLSAIGEIDHLIDSGQNLKGDEGATRTWLMQVLAFIHALDLPQDSRWQWSNGTTQQMSAYEADIRYALLDPTVATQAQKVLGILKGFRSGWQSRIPQP